MSLVVFSMIYKSLKMENNEMRKRVGGSDLSVLCIASFMDIRGWLVDNTTCKHYP